MSENDRLYDMVIPLGTPADVIAEVERRCNVKLVQRKIETGSGGKTTVLAFRGTKEDLEEARKVLRELMERKVEELSGSRRSDRS